MIQNANTANTISKNKKEIQEQISAVHPKTDKNFDISSAVDSASKVDQSDSLKNSDTLINSLHPKDTVALNVSIEEIKREKGNKIFSYSNDWMVGVLLFSIVLMAIIRFSFSKYLLKVFDSVINHQTSSNLLLEKNMRNLRGSMFLNLLFFVNLALYIVQYFIYIFSLNQAYNNIFTFLYCLGGLILLYSGKFVVIRLIGYIFNGVKESKEYLHTIFIYNKNLGVFLLPVTVSVPFIAQYATPLLLNAGLLMAILFYILRLFRGIKILFRQHVSIFYMILYLCALEILPLLMIYKLLYLLV